MVGKIQVKTAQGLMDVVAASGGLTRGIMLGASALVGDEMFASLNPDDSIVEEVRVDVDINEFETGGALAFSSALYSTGLVWTFRKIGIQSRAAFLSSATRRISSIAEALAVGRQVDSPRGFVQFERQGLQNLEDAVADLLRKQKAGKFEEILIDTFAIKRQVQDIAELNKEFDDTFRVLQYANTLGEGVNIDSKTGKMIGAEASLFTPKDQARLTKIAASNQMFGRREFATQVGNQTRVGSRKAIDIFADKDLALAAELFLPKKTSVDDLYNIADDLTDIRTSLAAGTDDMKNIVGLIDTLNSDISLKTAFLDEAAKGKIALTIDAMQGFLSNVRNSIMNIDDLVKGKMLPAVATAEKATESFLLRGAGKVVQGATYITLRSSLLGAARSSTYATKVANGFKWSLKGLGRLLWVDSAVWVVSGLIDLAFLEDEEDTFWGERWGVSPLGELIDGIFGLFLSEEQQADIAALVDGAIIAALTSDSLGGVVQTILDVFINEVKITIVPVDFALDETVLNPRRIPFGSITQDPLRVLEVFTYAIVAKIVFNAWILPSFGFLAKQMTGLSDSPE